MSITRLENFSNEIFYEIFEYLNSCFVYNTFTNLNSRFQFLLQHLSLPLKFHLPWTSQSIFQHYCTHIIAPNVNRIISLSIPNPLAIKYFLVSFAIETLFIRLETLNLGAMHTDLITSLLVRLKSLPHLSSLSLNINNTQDNISSIFQLIITLPVLKYFRISSEYDEHLFLLPMLARKKTQQESSIEHLVINGMCRFNQLQAMLSYTPQLTHLSCHPVRISNNESKDSISLSNLRKLYIKLGSIPFDLFKSFIGKVSSRLETLYIFAQYSDQSYLDAIEWQQLITYHMPYLRVFDFQYQSKLCDNDMKSIELDQLIERFNSEFWLQRKWFFSYQNRLGNCGHFKTLYSIRPYRRNKYKLDEYTSNVSHFQENSVYLCRHVCIHHHWNYAACSIRFPYAAKLTLIGDYAPEIQPFINSLNNILPLTQITELILEYEFIFIRKFIMLLQYMPNIHSLTFPQNAIIQTHILRDNELEMMRISSKNNRITKVTITYAECTLKQLHFLVDLCPRIEYLAFHLAVDEEDKIMKFLLSKMKENNYSFFVLCIICQKTEADMLKRIQSIVERENLLKNYTLDRLKNNIYLWF